MPKSSVARKILLAGVVALAVTAASIAPATGDEWTRFRGPNGSGISSATGLPVEFGPETNVVWKSDVPFGRSSPAVGTERVFLTAIEDGKLVTVALDPSGGEILWRREIVRGKAADLYKDTDSATPSPVTDGENVYAFFHESGLVSYDADGALRWHNRLGPFRNYYGIAASPILAGDLLLLVCDQAEGSFLLAVDKNTGDEIWRRGRPARLESYSTPILYPAADPEVVLVSGSRWVDAYDLATGRSVWTLPGVGTGPVSSPVLNGDVLFVNAVEHAENGWPDFAKLLEEHDADEDSNLTKEEVEGAWMANHFGWLDADASGLLTTEDWEHMRNELVNDAAGVYAIRLPGAGSEPEILWNYRQNVPYIPSPLVYDGVFYMIKDAIVSSLDPASGELKKRGRLDGASGKTYASPVAADGKIFIGTLEGKIAVLEAGAEWEVLGVYDLGEEIHGSPAIADGRILVRTTSALYSFAAPENAGDASVAPSR